MTISLELGKLPYRIDINDLQFRKYATHKVYVPKRFGIASAFPKKGWGMLGNDEYGDCAWASPAHSHMAMAEANQGHVYNFTTADVLSDYAAATGFDPADPNSDQGTYLRDAMKYRQKTGIVDETGNRHKILAYASLEAGNWEQMKIALRIFEAVEVGIEFPDSAMDQFNKGQTWQPVSGATIEGGHDIPILGIPDPEVANCITWGEKHALTRDFYEAYCDEAWVFVTGDMLDPQSNVNRAGFNLQQLLDDVKTIHNA